MRLGIIAAMEQELIVLTDKLFDMEKTTIANQQFYEGTIDQTPVVLVQSGIGKVNAAIAASLLINQYKVDSIINTGSAGGINKGLKVGDLVLSTELAYNDADARAFGYEFGQIPQMPKRYKADETLLSKLYKAASKSDWEIKKGLIVTGDSFISNKEKINEIIHHFSEALVTEMEGTAIAQTCYQFNIPFVVIRAVSDVADEKASISFDEFIDSAGKKSAEMVIEFIKLVKN